MGKPEGAPRQRRTRRGRRLVARRNLGRDHTLTRYALDTNFIAYAEGVLHASPDGEKRAQALELLVQLSGYEIQPVVAVQVLAELHHVLRRRSSRTPAEAAGVVTRWQEACHVVAGTPEAFEAAQSLAVEHKLQIYDALIIASVVGHADVLLSEDMQDGFEWRGVRVANPFVAGFSLAPASD